MTSEPQTDIAHGGGDVPSDMGTLLEESANYTTASRGAIVEGVVMGWDREGVFVDIGSKTEGIVPRSEMHSLGTEPERGLQSGDKVLVFIVQPETIEGQILLSIDRARGEKGWRVLQELHDSGESFEAQVTGFNKGGLLVNFEGVNSFVPLSQLVGVRPDRDREDAGGLSENVGRTLRLKVIEINRRRNRVILSERAALQEWRSQQKERLIEELREGDIRRGRVSSVRNFGVFVDLGGADGLAHLSELTWEREKSPTDLFKVGDEVSVYVTKVDHENKKIALSLRRANPGKWDEIVDKFKEGQVVAGLITKLVTFGAFAKIEGPIEGLVHVSELVDKRINHPREVVREGDLVPLKVVRIERDRHRLGLSLRRAREEGEALGFVFSEIGEVLKVPDDVRREFEEREGPLPVQAPTSAPTSETSSVAAPADSLEAAAEPAEERPQPAKAEAAPVAREPDPPTATMVLTPEQAQAIVGAASSEDSAEGAVTDESPAEPQVEEAPEQPIAEAPETSEDTSAEAPEEVTGDASGAEATEPTEDTSAEEASQAPAAGADEAREDSAIEELIKPAASADTLDQPSAAPEENPVHATAAHQNGTDEAAAPNDRIAPGAPESVAEGDPQPAPAGKEEEEPATL